MPQFKPHEAPVDNVNDLPLMLLGRPVGRNDLIRQVFVALRQNTPQILYGSSGIGKTTIAAMIAIAYAKQPDYTVLWLSVKTPPLAELLVRIGRAYGDHNVSNNQNPLSQSEVVASLLNKHKPLLVLDGEITAPVLEQFIDSCGGDYPILVTTTDLSDDDKWNRVLVPPLSPADAVVLFKQNADIKDDASDADVSSIVQMLNFEPFSISIASRAMTLSKQTTTDYAQTLQELVETLDNNGALAALTTSYHALNRSLQGLLLLLGATVNGEASSAFLGTIGGVLPANFDSPMNILSWMFLAEKFTCNDEPYYRLHPMVHQFIEMSLQNNGRLDEQRNKVKDAIRLFIEQYQDADDAHARLAAEMGNIIATAQWAVAQGDYNLTNIILVALSQVADFIQSEGYIYELLTLRALGSRSMGASPAYTEQKAGTVDEPEILAETDDESLGVVAVDDEADESLGVVAVDDIVEEADESLGVVAVDEDFVYDLEDDELEELEMANAVDETDDEPDDATFIEVDDDTLQTINIDQLRTALQVARQQQNTERQVKILQAIAKVQIKQGRESEAITSYNEVLQLYEANGDDRGQLHTLDMLSALLVRTDNAQVAVAHANQGLQFAEALDDADAEIRLLMTLGDAHQDLGEVQEAVEAYETAASASDRHDNQQNKSDILYKLGIAYLDNGDALQAIQTLQQANMLFKEQGNRTMEGQALRGLGEANAELERWSESINYHTSALHISREIGNRDEEVLQLSLLGQALTSANRLPEALLYYRQALHVAYLTGKNDAIVSASVELVGLMLKSVRLVTIAELLIEDAMTYDPTDQDVLRLRDIIQTVKQQAQAQGKPMAVIAGTAQDYAANAYES